MIISQIYRDSKECGQIGDRMSDKMRSCHVQVTKKYFQLTMKQMGLCLYIKGSPVVESNIKMSLNDLKYRCSD